MKSVLPESGVPSSEPGRMQSLERGPTPSGSGEAAVSFDLPAQADPLHCANKVMKPPLLACLPFFFFFFKRKAIVKQTKQWHSNLPEQREHSSMCL